MAKNVISVKGGEVHLPSNLDEIGYLIPFCETLLSADAEYLATDEKVTCKACKTRLRGRRAPVEEKSAEPAQIPKNWLYMAKHANTKTARAWWRKKCGIIETEN
jgi:hypothetical protein